MPPAQPFILSDFSSRLGKAADSNQLNIAKLISLPHILLVYCQLYHMYQPIISLNQTDYNLNTLLDTEAN